MLQTAKKLLGLARKGQRPTNTHKKPENLRKTEEGLMNKIDNDHPNHNSMGRPDTFHERMDDHDTFETTGRWAFNEFTENPDDDPLPPRYTYDPDQNLNGMYDRCKNCEQQFQKGDTVYVTKYLHDLKVSIPFPYCQTCINAEYVVENL